MKAVALARASGEAPQRLHRLQRPASSQRTRPGPRLRRHLADRRQDRRPGGAQVREHHLLRSAHGRQVVGTADPVPVALELSISLHEDRAARQLDHPGVLPRRRPAPGRGQPPPRLQPPVRRFRGTGGTLPPSGASDSSGGGASSTPSTTTPVRFAANWAPTTGRSSTSTSTPSATSSSGRPGSTPGWTCRSRPSPRTWPPPSSATCPGPRRANTGGRCSTSSSWPCAPT